MNISSDILHAVGATPLVTLNKVVPEDAATVLAKCEFMNPTGSIKDRMAAYIIERAEQEGLLKPGGTIVENTSGNTGQGVAMAAAVKGYKCVFTMPDKMSMEKVNMLKAFGAEVVITPTDVPGDSPDHYVNVAKKIAADTPGSYYVDQYHSPWNIDAHYHSTGREIYEDTDGGKFDAFVGGTGTGGTVSGVGRWMKEHAPDVKIIGIDPLGSVHHGIFHTGAIPTAYVYQVEGIGEDIACEAMDFSVVDDMRQVDDAQSFAMARRLVREEGLFCGGSSGSIVHGAVEIAKELGAGKTVVCVLPDSATRYITKYLSDDWMREKGFLDEGGALGLVEDLMARRDISPVTAPADMTIGALVYEMRTHGVSQIPIVEGGKLASIVHEADVLDGLQSGALTPASLAGDAAHSIAGLIHPTTRLEELFHIFKTDYVAVVVDGAEVVGMISKIDLIEYLTESKTD